jgi:hypothetical protein
MGATKPQSINETSGGVQRDADWHKAHAKRQAEQAKQREAKEKADRENDINPHVNSVLTTEEHVGKIANEPHKPKEMEALKTDQVDRTGVENVETRPRKTEGKGTTDEVVTEPPTGVNTGATLTPRSEADKAAEAINAPKSKGNAKRSRSRK